MKTSLVIKLIIIIAVIAGLGYILYKDYYKTKDFVFEAKIKEVVVNDNVYTILVEEYDKKDKEYVTEYEFELNKDTKIIYDNKETTKDQLKVNQKLTITASNEVMPSEPAKLSNVKKIVISKD